LTSLLSFGRWGELIDERFVLGYGKPTPPGTRSDRFHHGLIMTYFGVDLGPLGVVN
jgi:hypothetical protein